MRKLLLCGALVLSFALPVTSVVAQDPTVGAEVCPSGDVECVSRALDNRLRVFIETLPSEVLLAPPMPQPQLINTTTVLAGATSTGEKPIAANLCGKGMVLNVTGGPGAIGYMQCGNKVIQCQVPNNGNTCTTRGQVNPQAAGTCGVAATNTVPSIATCESYN